MAPHDTNEYACITVKSKSRKFTLISAYIQPTATFDTERLERVIQNTPSPHILCGDFNAHHELWGGIRNDKRGNTISELISKLNLALLNDGRPTFYRGTTVSSALDLSFVSSSFLQNVSWTTDIETRGSDHYPILLTVRDFAGCKTSNALSYTDWNLFSELAEKCITAATTNEELAPSIAHCLKQSTKKIHVPFHCTDIDVEYERLRAIRRRAERKARRTKTMEDSRAARKAQKKVHNYLDALSRRRWREFCGSLDTAKGLCHVWRVVRGLKTRAQQRHPFRALGLHYGCSDIEIAEAFCKQITQLLYPPLKDGPYKNPVPLARDASLDLPFTLNELSYALQDIRKHTAPGPDGVTYSALSRLNESARLRLLEFYNTSFLTGTLPAEWKQAKIVPVLKPGRSPLDLGSFRPIALTSCICKVMERMILARMSWFLEHKSLYPKEMAGFRAGRSAVDNVIELLSSVEQGLHERKTTVAIFLDVEKAFDSIDHQCISNAMIKQGFGGRIFNWVQNYLSERTVFMETIEGRTTLHNVKRGVPQGGALSPLLFNLALIDLPRQVSNDVHLSIYADDICLWATNANRFVTQRKLQKSLMNISRFLHCCSMSLSVEKTVAIAFTRMSMKRFPIIFGGRVIPFVLKHKFLGFTIDKHLAWNHHTKQLKSKMASAGNVLRFLTGTTWGKSSKSMLMLQKSLINSLLRYSLPVLNNICLSSSKSIEAELCKSLRTCLGVPPDTSSIGTIAEARALPLSVMAKQEVLRVHLRHKIQHRQHHLLDITNLRPVSSFGRILSSCSSNIPNYAEFHAVPSCPPWTLAVPHVNFNIPGFTKKTDQAQPVVLQHILNLLHDKYSNSTHVYTDGSTRSDSSSSAFVIPSLGIVEALKHCRVVSSTAAELCALKMALYYISKSTRRSRWTIFTDSRAALQMLRRSPLKASDTVLILKTLYNYAAVINKGHFVDFQWIPGHTGVPGNEFADAEADNAHNLAPTENIPFTRQEAARLVASFGRNTFLDEWSSTNTCYPHLHQIDPRLENSIPKKLPRKVETCLHRCRLNSAFTNMHMHRFGFISSPNCATCNVPEDLHHVICECEIYKTERQALHDTIQKLNSDPFSLSKILGPWNDRKSQQKAIDAFVVYIEKTDLISRI